jgi:nitroreductase
MLDLDQAIRERHSTRLFLSQPVPRELSPWPSMRHRTPTSSRGIWCSHLEHPGTASSPP